MRNKNTNNICDYTYLCLAASWIVYSLFGYRLIESVYKGESIAILNSLMKGRTSTSLEEYYTNK